ncbi:hypothetical protein L0665_05575 [Methanogenium marinum]|uniref:Uncharacterized protein n=1 Tax=Methanogenium marinum TaxID=348610 RepID=A0A9Q4KTQ5_9EURY|nr:hypothetical protein [Methanogenium marinum]MDE4908078.1 hypothetical protein [Methanogenium marinum]
MPKSGFPFFFRRITLITAIAVCLILSCIACGCTSFSSGTDDDGYQPSTFEPTIRPTHIPIPSPTIVCEPTDNLTAAAV